MIYDRETAPGNHTHILYIFQCCADRSSYQEVKRALAPDGEWKGVAQSSTMAPLTPTEYENPVASKSHADWCHRSCWSGRYRSWSRLSPAIAIAGQRWAFHILQYFLHCQRWRRSKATLRYHNWSGGSEAAAWRPADAWRAFGRSTNNRIHERRQWQRSAC